MKKTCYNVCRFFYLFQRRRTMGIIKSMDEFNSNIKRVIISQEEIAEGKKAIHVLGGQIAKVDTFDLLDCGERTIINVKKISSTPAKYPRPSAKIAKNPIK